MSNCKLEAPYPPAAYGEKRIVFALDPQEEADNEENDCMLQLIPARVMEMSKTMAMNIRGLPGKITRHTVEGWDVPYYHVELGREAAATRMGMPHDDGVPVRKVVQMGETPMFPYSSSVPVVVYLPHDAELYYSVWRAGEPMEAGSE